MTDFDSLFRKYHKRLILYSLKFVESEGDALDIVQNVFVVVWENRKYTLDDDHIQAYLFQSVRNSCINYLKHKRVIRKFEAEAAVQLKEMEAMHYQSGEKSLIETENLKQIYLAIDSLSDIYKEVIELSRFEGMKNHEIAQKLNLPLRTVETRIFRALSVLKSKISHRTFFILLKLKGLRKDG
ncbi:MAG: RNA polymerase sigma-70 factor [Prolixibacteraceae bacterium]